MKPAYVLQWQSHRMTAPAFWYFKTREGAEQTARSFVPADRVRVMVRETTVQDQMQLDD